MSKTFWDGMNSSLEEAVEAYNYSDTVNIAIYKVKSNGALPTTLPFTLIVPVKV